MSWDARKQMRLAKRVLAQARAEAAFASGKSSALPYSASFGSYRPAKKPVDARPGRSEGVAGNAGRPDAPASRRSSGDLRKAVETEMRKCKPGRPRK